MVLKLNTMIQEGENLEEELKDEWSMLSAFQFVKYHSFDHSTYNTYMWRYPEPQLLRGDSLSRSHFYTHSVSHIFAIYLANQAYHIRYISGKSQSYLRHISGISQVNLRHISGIS